jgi:elongation factor 2
MVTRVDKIIDLQNKPDSIRCIAVIAHVDHGKTTLSDALLAKAGLIDDDRDKRELDTLPDEKERGITIKSTAVSMCFDHPEFNTSYLVNLIDSPGHVDFSSEVTAALRVSDGAIVVVDCVEGVCVQTETVLRQALAERVKPVLVLNKLDRAILELQLDPETAYQSFVRTVESVNAAMSPFSDPALGDIQFYPEKGNVLFGSGLLRWGFTLRQWARKIASKQGGDPDKIQKRLWGDHFWDPDTKKFYTTPVSPSGKPLERYACKMMLSPLFKLVRAIADKDWKQIEKLLSVFDVKLAADDQEQQDSKLLFRKIMKRVVYIGDGLVELVGLHLPSPVQAQKYRVETLYEGPLDDEVATAIRNCDPKGPVALYVSKMVPTANFKQFFAFGRLFSGTLHLGQKAFILDPNNPGAKESKNIPGVMVMMGRSAQRVETVPCGNTVAVTGVDQILLKSGTITTSPTAAQIRAMKFTVSPVVRVAIRPKNPADLPKLIDGLRALSKSDPCVQVTSESSGEHILGCAGELHLEVCLTMLRRDFCKDIELVTSDPVVPFRETVSAESYKDCLVKSPNRHNRLFAKATPLSAEFCDDVDNKKVVVTKDSEARASYLVDNYGWDPLEAKRKIWCFGPEISPTNVVVDMTKGVQFLNEIKDSVVGAFQWATLEGPLCEEMMRGVRVNIVDVMLHGDAIHRGGGQIIPAARRLVHGSMLTASPCLMEPVYLVEVATTTQASSGVYSVLNSRRGHVFAEEQREGTPLVTLKAYLPVLESFGLTAALREACHGQAFPQCVMDHWQMMPGDPLEPGSFPHSVVAKVRARKGLAVSLPEVESFLDKL